MKLLLDTHAFLWATTAPERLSASASRHIEGSDNEIYVSAATGMEIAIKASLGRLAVEGTDVERVIPDEIERHAFQQLPVQVHHALRVASLPWHDRDPFDRLLVAQAMVEGLAIVTADRAIREYGVEVIW